MKKVFIAAIIFAASGFSFAYVDSAIMEADQVETTVSQDGFVSIETDKLPEAIREAVATLYNNQTIKAAYVKETESGLTYRVTLADADKTTDVLFNEKGEVLPAETRK